MLQRTVDRGILAGNEGVILHSSLIMVGLILVSAAATVGITVCAVRTSQRLGADLRRDLFARVLSLSFHDLDQWRTGQLLTRLSSDIQQVTQFTFFTGRMFLRVPLVFTGSLILMALTNWRLSLMMLFIIPAATVVFLWYANRAEPMFMQVQRRLDRLNTILQENVAGVRAVKAFVRATHENARFDQVNVDLTERNIRVGRFLAILPPTLQYLVNLGIVFVVGVGGVLAMRGQLSLGEILAFNSYLLWVMMSLSHLGMMVSFISASAASAQRIYEVLDQTPTVTDGDTVLPGATGRAALRGVQFAYDGHEHEPVLQDINLTLEPGQTVALLGATGSGKSTLISQLPRFYDVDQGQVTLDDGCMSSYDVRALTLESLRAHIGLAPQETLLFSGTIRDNIRYGRPEAGDEEVEAAARAAQAHDFITGFPESYDTLLGQRGVNLSGGQKQRLAIARALLMQPRLLILDDSTSSVDVETEVRIQEALEASNKERTTLLVAQRISSVLGADQIAVLDGGRIMAVGNHRELLATCAIYREIYESQLGNGPGGGVHHE
jgi:ATP-binding cassette subfamily B protein